MHHLYYNINLHVSIGELLEFTVCQSIKISKSIKDLTSTATLQLPREFKNAVNTYGDSIDLSGKSILDYIKRGDEIKIAFGYDGDLETEFEGYITSIGADVPMVLECEDEMFQLKKTERVTEYVESGNLKDILEAVMPGGYDIEINAEYKVGPWLIDNATAYEVLTELKQKAGVSFFFKDKKTLKAGLPIDFDLERKHLFNFDENICTQSNLNFKRKEDRKLEVTVNSKQPDGTENSASVGQQGGDTKTINFPGLSEADCQKWADKEHQLKSFEGFDGSFDSWCVPRTQPGDVAELKRPFYEDGHQDGRYFIEAVSIAINASKGIKRTNQISYKL